MPGTDTRTIILGDDGRYSTLGRASYPNDDEIAAAGAALAKLGVGGWLATMDRTEHGRAMPRIEALREVAPPRHDFAAAVAAFQAGVKQRRAALKAQRAA